MRIDVQHMIVFTRVVAMLLFGAMGIGETLAFAPDYAKARTAASKLFALFDRVPPIDVASNEGKQIVSVLREITDTYIN